MRFDIRVSAQALNIYAPAMDRPSPLGSSAYLTVYSPDGKPAIADIEVLSGKRVIFTAETNRFGMAKVVVHPRDAISGIRARSGSILAVAPWEAAQPEADAGDDDPVGNSSRFQIQTDRALYRPGQAVQMTIRSINNTPPGQILVWKGSELLVSKPFVPAGNETRLTLSYDSRFTGVLTLGFASHLGTAAHAIVFPEPDPFKITIKNSRSNSAQPATYRPGETVPLVMTARDSRGKPVEAAFGVSIVDSAVVQRAAFDDQFSRPRYDDFERSQNDIRYGGLALEDLPLLDPTEVDADIQLAAEALLDASTLPSEHESLTEMLVSAFGRTMTAPHGDLLLSQQIERLAASTFRFPQNEVDLTAAVPTWHRVKDPWGTPYRPTFGTEDRNRFIHWISAGPDKIFDTAHDFVGMTAHANWFRPFETLIFNALHPLPDLPSSTEEASALFESHGMAVTSIRDPWGTPLRLKISHRLATRVLRVESAGLDGKFDTKDDVLAEQSVGTWFRAMSEKLDAAVRAAQTFPRNEGEFVMAATAASIDFHSLRDPWGHPYGLTFSEADRYENRVRIFSKAEYNSAAQQRRVLESITVHVRTIEVRSPGEDGVAGTYDDGVVATFETTIVPPLKEAAAPQPATLNPMRVAGTGTLTGIITDSSGGTVAGATVTLDDKYVSTGDANGVYRFSGVLPGAHGLVVAAAGFQVFMLSHIPVEAGKITRADGELTVGSVAETVDLVARPSVLMTLQSSVASRAARSGPTETARVRNYFAETLLCEPELVTDKNGAVHLPVKLADNITTWRVAVTASAVDGHTAEAASDIRAFLPFFADLDPPPVLTVGDEIDVPILVRNYTDARQNVGLDISTPAQLTALRMPAKQQSVGPQRATATVVNVGRSHDRTSKSSPCIKSRGRHRTPHAKHNATRYQPRSLFQN